MKYHIPLAIVGLLAMSSGGLAQEGVPTRYLSLQQEIKLSVARGNTWLGGQQHAEGYWGTADMPAFTALALTALVRDPGTDLTKPLPEAVKKGFDWLLRQQKEDGGIYNKGLAVYNTATAITALVSSGREEYEPAIVRARKYLVGEQWDVGKKGETDNVNDGGIGYGSKNDRSDLSNTSFAIEALALSRKVIEDGKYGDQPELDWEAAITFLSRCQNLRATNDQDWASDDVENKGGFVYGPGESKAGEMELPDGKTALRSYGSISYQGLLSLIYAKLAPDDPRVVAVKEWLGRNYSVEENPGMGPQGLFYYYQAMSKALSAAGVDQLPLKDGKTADWRRDVSNKMLSKQREDGSWANHNGRWMESDPVLVTSYTVLALEQIYQSIPTKP